MVGDAAQHIAEICFRVEAIQLGCFDEAVEGGSAICAAIRPYASGEDRSRGLQL